MADQPTDDGEMIISYLTLRKIVGALGLALPLVLALGAWLIFQTGLRSSISAYYHTGMRDVFVGTLWALGSFLFSYNGPERVDAVAGKLGGVFAVGITLFPSALDGATGRALFIGRVHFAFAALFFLTLIFFSLFLFTKTRTDKPPTPEKIARNRVYRVCGFAMAASMLLLVVYYRLPAAIAAFLKPYNLVFWLETIMIVAFGISWLTKGEAILRDREPEEDSAAAVSETKTDVPSLVRA